MDTKKAISLHLEPEDHAQLEAEATRLGQQPGELALAYVLSALPENPELVAEKRRRQMLAALKRFDALRADVRRAGYPSVDAAKLVCESREDLERRPAP